MMVELTTWDLTVGLLALQSLLVVLVLMLWVRQRRGRAVRATRGAADRAPAAAPDPAGPDPSTGKGRLVVPSGLRIQGVVTLVGHVLLRAADAADARAAIDLDVPTEHVDRVLAAFRHAGFDVRDTGVTVDTDEGEETLTTLELGLESLHRAVRDEGERDLLRVMGDLEVETGARVAYDLEAAGTLRVGDRAEVHGDLRGHGTVLLGQAVRVEGEVHCDGDVEVGAGAEARAIRSGGQVRLEGPPADLVRRVEARSVKVDRPPGEGA